MKLKISLAITAISAMALSSFAQGGPGPGPGGPGGPGMGGPGRGAPVDWSKLPPPSDKKGVTYAADIKPLIDANCLGCHGANRPSGGLNLSTLEGIMAGARGRGGTTPVVEVGKSADSALVKSVSRLDPRTAMPRPPRGRGPGGPGGGTNAAAAPTAPQPHNFTAEEVGLVRAWIDQGAK